MQTLTPAELTLQASQQAAQGRILDAESTLARAVALDPGDSPDAIERRIGLAQLRTRLGFPREAVVPAASAVESARRAGAAGLEISAGVALARAWLAAGVAVKAIGALDALPATARTGLTYWSLRADALRQARRWPEAADAARMALGFEPAERRMRLILAAALGHQGDWQSAEPLFAEFGDDPAAVEMKMGAMVARGREPEAASLAASAIGRRPDALRLMAALAQLRWMMGDRSGFADPLLERAAQFPDDVAVSMTTADLLRRGGRREEAIAVLERTASRIRNPALSGALAILHSDAGHHARALELIADAMAGGERVDWVRRNAACVLLAAGRPGEAIEHTRWGLSLDPFDQEWIAIDAVARRADGDASYRNAYDYDHFVRAFELPAPPGFASAGDFIDALARRLRELHRFSEHPLDQSLRGGTQVQLDPEEPQDPLVETFFAALKAPLEAYLQAIGNDAANPFTARNTGQVKMTGCWSVRLVRGGSHVNHIHPEGWISSAFYVTVPDEVARSSNTHAGWIEFGEPYFPVPGIRSEHAVQPEAGRLVLFPSYMWHGVRAFEEGEERMTIAMDFIPAP